MDLKCQNSIASAASNGSTIRAENSTPNATKTNANSNTIGCECYTRLCISAVTMIYKCLKEWIDFEKQFGKLYKYFYIYFNKFFYFYRD